MLVLRYFQFAKCVITGNSWLLIPMSNGSVFSKFVLGDRVHDFRGALPEDWYRNWFHLGESPRILPRVGCVTVKAFSECRAKDERLERITIVQ